MNVRTDYVSRSLKIIRLLCIPISKASLKRLDGDLDKQDLEDLGLDQDVQVLGGITLLPK